MHILHSEHKGVEIRRNSMGLAQVMESPEVRQEENKNEPGLCFKKKKNGYLLKLYSASHSPAL